MEVREVGCLDVAITGRIAQVKRIMLLLQIRGRNLSYEVGEDKLS